MVCLNAPSNFLVQRFRNLDSKDLGLGALGMKNDRKKLCLLAPDDSASQQCTSGVHLNERDGRVGVSQVLRAGGFKDNL